MKRVAVVLLLLMVFACSSTSDSGPHATILMRDGSSISGKVVSSSPSEIRIITDANETRTIPMSQVKTVDYGDAPSGAPAGAASATSATGARPPAKASHANHNHPVEAVITTQTYELPAGTELAVRTEETIDSARAADGQTFAAEVTQDVLDADGKVVIPDGANAQIVIKSSSSGSRVKDASDLILDLATVSVEGRQYQLDTVDLNERGREGVGKNKRTAEFVGGGAAIGAVIGAITGQGKGAAIGAGSGAGAGLLAQVLTKGGSIKIPVETVLTFKLEKALRVVSARK
ncbi:MAG: hypothetical protein HY047_11205 [Acidobacteria bacterium]|nr:hypothetical protein [Acidobacteriota bacterium]